MIEDEIAQGESARLEFKLQPSDSFLKTVVAFANCGGGRILFGVLDWGNAIRIVVYRKKVSQKASQKVSQKTKMNEKSKIVELMRANSGIGTQQIADRLGVSRRTVTNRIRRLKEAGIVRRVGPDKGGYWVV